MKKSLISFIALLFLGFNGTSAQITASNSKSGHVFYSVIVNNVPDGFIYPLIGVVNNANGNHTSMQLGLFNITHLNFEGFQVGVVNSIVKDLYGFHCGLMNTVENNVNGIEGGFLNIVGSEVKGAQFGCFNSTFELKGIQYGLINNVGNNAAGYQNGLMNTVGGQFSGFQTGIINKNESTVGVQYGLVNQTKRLKGLQLGFINCVDTIEAGLPIGVLSFVKHGGFAAMELSTNENFLLNLSYKIGIRSFYTFPVLSLASYHSDKLGIGLGFGSNISISNRLVFDPEFSSTFTVSNNSSIITTLNISVGLKLTNKLVFLAGPSFTCKRYIVSTDLNKRKIWEFDHDFDFEKDLSLGFKCALRYTLI